MHIFFFLAPFLLLAGVFCQGLSLFLLLILGPYWWLRQRLQQGVHWEKRDRNIALALMGIYTIFPLVNIVSYVLPPAATIAHYGAQPWLGFRKIFFVPLSSSLFFSGLLLFVFARIAPSTPQVSSSVPTKVNAPSLLNSFSKGMLVSSLMLLSYGLVQHVTGFDYRYPNWTLPGTELFADHRFYRVCGFYGHPLSLAGASLGIFTFYWHLFFASYGQKMQAIRAFLIAGIHLGLIALSGGRAPLCVAFGLLVVIPLLQRGATSGLLPAKRTKLVAAMVLLLGLITSASGVALRFGELFFDLLSGGADRFKFWNVYWHMFLDRPWLGHGSAYIKHFSRDLYYHELGYASLVDKYNAHNIYLEIAASVGLFGLVLVLVAGVFIARDLRSPSRGVIAQTVGWGSVLALGANCLFGLTQNTFFDASVLYIHLAFFWLVLWIRKLDSLPSSKYTSVK